jgi:hypothetical protein
VSLFINTAVAPSQLCFVSCERQRHPHTKHKEVGALNAPCFRQRQSEQGFLLQLRASRKEETMRSVHSVRVGV